MKSLSRVRLLACAEVGKGLLCLKPSHWQQILLKIISGPEGMCWGNARFQVFPTYWRVCQFPWCKYPYMFCFWLPTIQWLAPKMFQCVTIESCKTIQASFNKLQGGIHILNLPSFWVGARPWLCLEKQETQTSGDACLLLIHVECLVVPQVLPASTASLHLHGRPALRGQHTIVLPAKSSIIQQALLNWK